MRKARGDDRGGSIRCGGRSSGWKARQKWSPGVPAAPLAGLGPGAERPPGGRVGSRSGNAGRLW